MELTENPSLLREMIDSVDAIVGTADDRVRKVTFGPQIERILGYRPSEISTYDAWMALVHPDDLARCLSIWEGPDPHWVFDYRVRRADGRWARVRERGLRADGRNAPDGLGFVVLIDVTDEHAALAALRWSEARYADLVERIPVGILLFDEEDDGSLELDYLSPPARRLLRIGEADPTDVASILAQFDPVDAAAFGETRATARASGGPLRWEGTLVGGGAPRRLRIEAERTDRRGSGKRWHGVIEDVTAVRAAEEASRRAREEREAAIQESEALYRRLIEAQTAAYFWEETIEDDWLVYLSPPIENLVKLPVEWFRGRSVAVWRSIIHPSDRARVERAYRDVWEGSLEYRIVRGDGVVAWVQAQGVLVRDDDGTPVRRIGITLDRTAARAAAETRRRRESQVADVARLEAAARVASSTAHDFRSILTGIEMFANLLAKEKDLPPRAREDVEKIREALGAAQEAVVTLSSLGRLAQPNLERIDVHELLASLRPELGAVLGEDAELILSLRARRHVVTADRTVFRRTLYALLVNALDAGARHVTVATEDARETSSTPTAVGTAGSGPHLTLAVTDDGSGMTRATAARAFEPYFTTKALGERSGLGMSSAHALVRAADGHAHIESRPGQGTTIRLCLPVQRAKP